MLENGQKAEKQGSGKIGIALLLQNSLTADSNIPQCKSFKVLPRVPKFKDIFSINISLFHMKIKQRGGDKMGSNMGVREKGAFKRWTRTERKF